MILRKEFVHCTLFAFIYTIFLQEVYNRDSCQEVNIPFDMTFDMTFDMIFDMIFDMTFDMTFDIDDIRKANPKKS